jgi:membrane fusion protein, heavy metal efflux system
MERSMKRIVLGGMIALVVLGLAGLGLAVARPDLVPAWAQFRPAPEASADSGLYCKEHGVPEKFCTLCHEELKTTLLLCKEHGDIPEDICTLCHPEVQKAHNIEMCPEGHGLPKHFCTECGTAPSASLDLPDDGWCATHNTPEALCLECQKDPGLHDRGGVDGKLAAGACRVPLPTVRLASARLAERVGIETATAVEEEHAHTLVANAETAYDANRYADISPRVDGFLREVRVDLGRSVLPGEVLAVVDSATVSAAKAQYVSAHDGLELAQVTYDRIRSLRGTVAGKQEIEARTALNQAKANAMDAEQKLRNFGFDDAQLAKILRERDTRGQLNIVAPIGGTVVLRHAVRGEAVQATTQLFSVADTSKMWLWIDVYEVDVAKVALGQRVAFVASGAETEPHEGRITWLGNEVNERTRTTRVRAEVENEDGHLRANQFGRVEIRLGAEHKAVVVPKAAIQRQDKTDLVFLPEDGGRYRPQRVLVRPTNRGEFVEVAWGLKPGQRVVTTGSFLLKTEIMKGAIGAGCCE